MLEAEARWAREWLFDAALPLWWQVGADPAGGFFEKIALDGKPVIAPRRLRVQTRQTYAFIEGGRLGWQGPWREAAEHGLSFFMSHYRRADGLYRSLVAPDGSPLDETADLYDQAFVLFALAHARGAGIGDTDLLAAARSLQAELTAQRAHPVIGFEEATPRVLPLRSNPHMHLLEAQLAWVAEGVSEPFEGIARAIVELGATRLLDPRTGAIGEYYDGDWNFAEGTPGAVREPGHQFEWAYLFRHAGDLLGVDHRAAADRLYAFGTCFGIAPDRRTAIFAVDAAGTPTDPRARLWAQTERLRTALVFLAATSDTQARDAFIADAREAFEVLKVYLDVPVAGLWRDQWLADGSFLEEPAPASSFYHILSAFVFLLKAGGLA
ncbi:AGE family epimerase/isomerase [Xanthobacter sp.]|uniref:AGE family epimerase/isomerase n=1 Tax=Xanthobacter sp. TaxID=35809 RepID=UPI0025EC2F8F|nr:AGE family epimerase/isomerase [Xanthobacter sp.]